ncbi:hypothetical protein JQ580_31860 [Bradyrhizobium japonicum]|jgi:hypothetical protein|uniref:hypothetical protein n=1 Tax=Bradyrhizobium japonicum TaxID=375 RepID=UPI001BA68A08|nr:hypothetical protein [Bradyrhizobium japonicum]MBR0995316.1 hypothetical protein [Bradyrhizobium japonicum]
MAHSDHGIVRDQRGEEQPRDKQRAQSVNDTDPQKTGAQKTGSNGSPSREATRDPKLNDNSKTPGSGMTPNDSGDAPTG